MSFLLRWTEIDNRLDQSKESTLCRSTRGSISEIYIYIYTCSSPRLLLCSRVNVSLYSCLLFRVNGITVTSSSKYLHPWKARALLSNLNLISAWNIIERYALSTLRQTLLFDTVKLDVGGKNCALINFSEFRE